MFWSLPTGNVATHEAASVGEFCAQPCATLRSRFPDASVVPRLTAHCAAAFGSFCAHELATVSAWSSQDPAGAAAWVGAFPEGQTRDSAISSVVSGWTQNDPQGASKWLESLPAGKSRDKAAETFLNQASYQEPALAARWAMELYASASTQPGRENRNTYQLENVARNWMNVDERAARAWIAQAPLSEEKKKALLNANRKPEVELKR